MDNPFTDLVYSLQSHNIWNIYRQDAGMGEKDYAIMRDGEFFARTGNEKDAIDIVRRMA